MNKYFSIVSVCLFCLMVACKPVEPPTPPPTPGPDTIAPVDPDTIKPIDPDTITPVDPNPQPQPTDDPIEFAMSMAPGWNLGNNLDAANNGKSSETAWGNRLCTQRTMDSVKAAGFNSVRIPVSWIGHIGAAPDYTIETAWMDRVVKVVGYAHNAGLKAIINVHHDGNPDVAKQNYWLDIRKAVADTAYNRKVKEELAAVWTQIANRFVDEDYYLIFEGLNEINDGAAHSGSKDKQMAIMNEWNQTFVNAVRATGSKNKWRFLAITSFYARCDLAAKNLELPVQNGNNRIMVAVHSYDPWNFAGAGTDASWGHTGSQSTYGENECSNRLKPLYDKFVSKGVPVYMGECGAVNRKDAKQQEYQRYYLEYYARVGYTYSIPFILWDNGADNKTGEEAFGYLNHNNGAYINNSKPLLDAFVRAQTDNSPEYTLKSIYDRAPAK